MSHNDINISPDMNVDTNKPLPSLDARDEDKSEPVQVNTKRIIVKYERSELIELSTRRLSREKFSSDIQSLTTENIGPSRIQSQQKSFEIGRGRRTSEVAKSVTFRGGFNQSQRKTSLGNQQDNYLNRPGPSWSTGRTNFFVRTGDCEDNVNPYKSLTETRRTPFREKYERNEGSKFNRRKLEEILSKEPDAAVVALSRFTAEFSSFVSQPNIGKDLLILTIQIIGQKLCSDDLNLKELRNPLLAVVCSPDFLKQLKVLTNSLAEEEEEEAFGRRVELDKTPCRVLTDLRCFYNVVWTTMPNFATDHFLVNIKAAKNTSMILKMNTQLDTYTNLESEFSQLESSVVERKRQIEEQQKTGQTSTASGPKRRIGISKGEVERMYMANPPDDFRTISVTPRKEELITEDNPFLRPSIETGSYPSSDVYLDVQFRLLREDFIHPLREGIRDYLQNCREYSGRKRKMPFGTVRIYRDVKFVKIKLDGFVTVYSLQFPAEKFRKIRWDMSKRLITGSLLCLTPDNFQNVYLATVATSSFRRNEDLSQGILDVFWEGDQKPEMNKNVSYLMMECEVYFEAYRHTLSALQNTDLENYPMKKYIVDAKHKGIPPPSYLETTENFLIFDAMLKKDSVLLCANNYNTIEENSTEKDPSESEEKVEEPKFKVQPLDSDEWPSASDFGMDDSQYSAFQNAITKELSVIQGPPGTGKTYIGLQVVKLILNNPQIYDTGYPILIVCYTNHALDQFLEGIIDLMEAMGINPLENLIRIGSRSKLDRLEPYNIRERMKYEVSVNNIFAEEYDYRDARSIAFRTLKNLQHSRKRALNELKGLYNMEGIINFRLLCDQQKLSRLCPPNLRHLFFLTNEWDSMALKSMINNKTFTWLELTDDDFRKRHFDPMRQLRKIFKVLTTNMATPNKEQTPLKINNKILPAGVEKVPVNEIENNVAEEEFDMEELMSHRFDPEVEIQTETNERDQYEFPYAISASVIENHCNLLSRIIRRGNEKLEEIYADAENMKQNLGSYRILKEELERYEYLSREIPMLNNVKIFLGTLMKAFRNKWIELPAITPEFLARAAEMKTFAEDGEDEIFQLDEKWALYFYLTREARKLTETRIMTLEQDIMQAQAKLKEANTLGEAMLLKTVRIVGMTTTGAAKYSTLLRMMQSPIVIVEEAAEVLEAHIVTSITKYCQHLILIGDHKQLRPSTNVYKLSKDYNLDVSLFERFINNNISSCQLRIQHRMRPNICKLLVPTIYEDLENHESVLEYPRVLGVTKSLFFVTHTEEEISTEDSATKTNKHEAKFLVKLCRYLILQGYKPGQITIITTYLGQMFLLKDLKKKESQTCRGVRITVVDNFQGEENDIILLSLVRSNPENKIGFLKTDNRICVALSRAKHALYIVANMQCLLASGSPTWEKINQELQNEGNIGTHLELKCEIHGDITLVQTSTDFHKVPEGGCSQMCERVLACGHICRLVCHSRDRDHIEYECVLPCPKNCPNNHPCPKSCYKDCGKCIVRVNKKLPCGHEEFLECHMPPSVWGCMILVEKDLPCGHKKWLNCKIDPSSYRCHEQINKSLPCGHAQISNCYEKEEDIWCDTLFTAKMPNCGHWVEVECFKKDIEEHWECTHECDRQLLCGHTCGKICHIKNDPDHENHVCKKPCGRTCDNDHNCQGDHECRYKCPRCDEITTKTLQCGHQTDVQCYVRSDSILCQQLCSRVLDCGHECLLKCSEDCKCMETVKRPSISCKHEIEAYCYQTPSKEICETLVDSEVLSACGHKVKIPCKIELNATAEDCLQYCENPCDEILGSNENGQCGHRCTGNCFQCHQGRIHKRCAEKCERSLVCGHFCKVPCASMCPCCPETCYFKCEHSKCVQQCGFPCLGCNERCGWSCSHAKCTKLCREKCDREPCDMPCTNVLKCGHNCIGLCGEVCPTFCKICDAEEVQEILFGEEDDPNARFIFLEDCGHVIEVKGMDQHMKTVIVVDGVSVKKCPKCSTVIRNSRRYGAIMNTIKKDIVDIKKRIQGYDESIERKMEKIVNTLFKCRNESILKSFREFLAERTYTVHGKKKTISPNTLPVDQYNFESLDNMMEWWKTSRKNLNAENELRPEDKIDLSARYERFFNIIMQRLLPLSRKEIMDLEREFEKMSAWWKLYRRYAVIQIVPTIPGVPEKLEQLTSFLKSVENQQYTKTVETKCKLHLKEMDELINKTIHYWKVEEMNPENRSIIFKAVGFGTNHWYKCPNGHLYVVANCGLPNQISTCPECKSVIGGVNHEFEQRNTRATEEDILFPLSNLPDMSFLENSQI